MRAAFVLALAVLAVGCKESAPAPASSPSAEASIPFRIDGSLSFVRGADTLRIESFCYFGTLKAPLPRAETTICTD